MSKTYQSCSEDECRACAVAVEDEVDELRGALKVCVRALEKRLDIATEEISALLAAQAALARTA
jgi:hypothetical protein